MKRPFWSHLWFSGFWHALSFGFALDMDWLLGYGHCFLGEITFNRRLSRYLINLDRP